MSKTTIYCKNLLPDTSSAQKFVSDTATDSEQKLWDEAYVDINSGTFFAAIGPSSILILGILLEGNIYAITGKNRCLC